MLYFRKQHIINYYYYYYTLHVHRVHAADCTCIFVRDMPYLVLETYFEVNFVTHAQSTATNCSLSDNISTVYTGMFVDENKIAAITIQWGWNILFSAVVHSRHDSRKDIHLFVLNIKRVYSLESRWLTAGRGKKINFCTQLYAFDFECLNFPIENTSPNGNYNTSTSIILSGVAILFQPASFIQNV